jgi:type VI protein secretion system component VasF
MTDGDERRARIIAQLQRQVIAACDDQAAQSEAKLAETFGIIQRRRRRGSLFVMAMMAFSFACLAALVGMATLAD